jgi:hypothetical protein
MVASSSMSSASTAFQSITSTFHLPPASLRNLLLTNDALMAGPTALTGYLQQNGKTGFDAPRMDIWINGRHPQWMYYLLATQPHLSTHHRFITFLEKNNYVNMNKIHTLLGGVPNANDSILQFSHPLGKVIRLLFVDGHVRPDAVMKCAEFNLDNCWYNHDTDTFHSHSSSILHKHIYGCPRDEYIPSMESLTDCQRIHLEFYLSVGFILGEEDCRALEERDPRIMTDSILQGVKAFDVCAYEEVDTVEFLDASYWNILLKTGNQFQAFDRAVLYDYMKEHPTYATIGEDNIILYDTPLKQSVSHRAVDMFLWSDYSIVELVPFVTVEVDGQPKSVMHVHFYKVAEWNQGVPGHSVL